jgi:hypothetical protein
MPGFVLPLRSAVGSVVLLVGLLLSALAWAGDSGRATSRMSLPVIESAQGGECVADPAFMRRNHMDLLKHQRNETVHGGVRKAPYALKDCIACHASKTTQSVAALDTNFCKSCHIYTAVKIDCFECHATKPQAKP